MGSGKKIYHGEGGQSELIKRALLRILRFDWNIKQGGSKMNNAIIMEKARTYKTKDAFVLDMLQQDLRKPDIINEKLQAETEKLILMPEGKERVALANKLKKILLTKKTKSLSAGEYSKIWEKASKL